MSGGLTCNGSGEDVENVSTNQMLGSNLIISLFDGVKSLDTIAEKAGIFLGSETGLHYCICAF
jgi:hypothetical protein